MNNSTSQNWLDRFPALATARDPELQRLIAATPLLQVPAGVTVFRTGDACERYLMVLEGSVRVQKLAENGREIVLYRVVAGETCVLTTSCLLAGEHYPAEGVTESPVTAVGLPLAQFQEALACSETFRRFVFASFGERLAELMTLVEALAFGRLDSRLAQCLLDRGQSTSRVTITHQQLAAELGSAREVVSRLLKELERHGWIALERGEIAILDAAALARLANP
jgi:CRP/FNR family transcriptional regulator, anaerobic regulatory protein